MRSVLIGIIRHLVAAVLAVAVSIVISQLVGIDGKARFFDLSIGLVVVFLISLHWRWLFGLTRRTG